MQYVKGSFTILPNRDAMRGKPPIIQVVYTWICHYANEAGECYPSFTRLSIDAGISRPSAIKAIKELEEIGVISKKSRSKDGSQTSNLYSLRLVGGSKGGLLGVVNDVYQGSKGGLPELYLSNYTYSNYTPHTPRAKRSESLEGFDEFWSSYPRKTAKQNALKAWSKISPAPDLRVAILSGLESHKASEEWERDDGRYIPHAATFLNGRRWEDEVKQATRIQTIKL